MRLNKRLYYGPSRYNVLVKHIRKQEVNAKCSKARTFTVQLLNCTLGPPHLGFGPTESANVKNKITSKKPLLI